jgi:hypothetical protein
MGRRLTLIAGSGGLPLQVAEAAMRSGDSLQVLDLIGRGDLPAERVRQIPVSDAMALRAAVTEFRSSHLVLAGGVKLSDSDREGIAQSLGAAGRLARSLGDVALAVALFAHFRMHGVRVIGAHEVVVDLLTPEGQIAGPPVSAELIKAARRALRAARAIGRIDLGQAIVSSGRRVIAAEDAGGTDALLARVAILLEQGFVGAGSTLILAKALKPRQLRFVDLPSIGPQTIRGAAAAGVSVIAVEAGKSIVLERPKLIAEAATKGVAVVGVRV